ncbi:unnamed protein product [Diamesa serratosioi]
MMKVFIVIALVVCIAVAANAREQLNNLVEESEITAFLIAEQGYPVEEHYVNTPDGYILKVFRIPGSVSSPPAQNKRVVFLQHGLLCSSADWVVLGKGKALAYLLADAGYDVWLGNARGNTNSRKHQYLSPNHKDFWNFSWHEIGQIDLPAMIDFVLLNTGEKDLHYVGHSQGTTSFFVMTSLRKEMNAKIRTMHALAPVAFMSKLVSPFLRVAAPLVDQIETVMKMFGVYEFMPSNEMMVDGGKYLCKDQSLVQEVCANVLFLIGGYNSAQLNRTIVPTILENTPAGSSVNQLVHYAQGINSGKFRMFDYGLTKNLLKYGSLSPPNYNLGSITAPVYLHYGDNDWMAAVKDVDELASKLGNLAGKFLIADPKFNHLDFTYATDADKLVYNRIISLMNDN